MTLRHEPRGSQPRSAADESRTLDPSDWPAFRAQAHGCWTIFSATSKTFATSRLAADSGPDPLPNPRRSAQGTLRPRGCARGNSCAISCPSASVMSTPGFMGWVHGRRTPVGAWPRCSAAGLNANLGGRDRHPHPRWNARSSSGCARIFGFPEGASGLFVTGTSMANLIGVLIARDAELGFDVRCAGVAAFEEAAAYTSRRAHSASERP